MWFKIGGYRGTVTGITKEKLTLIQSYAHKKVLAYFPLVSFSVHIVPLSITAKAKGTFLGLFTDFFALTLA